MGQSKRQLSNAAIPTSGRCSICGAPAVLAFRPFCSRRCSDVDLSRWLRGAYAIPGGQVDADEDGDESRPADAAGSNLAGDQERGHEND